jgi:hypothetical protein
MFIDVLMDSSFFSNLRQMAATREYWYRANKMPTIAAVTMMADAAAEEAETSTSSAGFHVNGAVVAFRAHWMVS